MVEILHPDFDVSTAPGAPRTREKRCKPVLRLAIAALTGPLAALSGHGVVYYEVDSIPAPTSAAQMIYAPAHNKLVLKNSASAVATIDPTTKASTFHLSNARFTDITASASRNFIFVADYGYENIGYSTPNAQNYVHRLDLATGTWGVNTVYIAGNVEPVSDTKFVLKSSDQWVSFTNNLWTAGSAAAQLGPVYGSGSYYGDFRYHAPTGRILHGGSGSSSQELHAYALVNDAFVAQESSGIYGTAQGYGGTVEMATDGSAFYYGRLQVDPLNVAHNLRAFPELIYAATGDVAFGNGNYYDAHTGQLIGNLGVQATVYGLNPNGQDFWIYDAPNSLLRHFATNPAPAGACTLSGNRISLLSVGAISGTAVATIQNGNVEFAPAPGNPNISVDIEDSTIRIFNNSASVFTFNVATTYSVIFEAGSPVEITGAASQFNVISGTPVVSRNAQSVSITLTGTTWQPGDSILVGLKTTCAPCSLDADGSGTIDALTDGIVLLRALFGLTGTAVTNNALGAAATRRTWTSLRPYLNNSCGASFGP